MHVILKWIFCRIIPSALAALALALCLLILYTSRGTLMQSLTHPEWHHVPFWLLGTILLVLYLLIPLLAARLMWQGEYVLLGRWISGLFSLGVFIWLFGLPVKLAFDYSATAYSHPFSGLIVIVVWIYGCLKIARHIDRWANRCLDSLHARWTHGNKSPLPHPGTGA